MIGALGLTAVGAVTPTAARALTHQMESGAALTQASTSAIASSSELVEMLIGKTLEEAKAIKNVEIVEALELPPIKIHCSVLAEDSIRQAIEDYEAKQ